MEGSRILHIDVRQTARVTYVLIRGRVDRSNSSSLAFELDDLHDDENAQLVFDLRQMTADAAGHELILRAEDAARSQGKAVSTTWPDADELRQAAG